MPSPTLSYLQDISDKADASRAAWELCKQTLRNRPEVQLVPYGVDELTLLKLPPGKVLVAHLAAGNSKERDVGVHAGSFVDKLYRQAMAIGAEPLAFTNVRVANNGEKPEQIAPAIAALVDKANEYGMTALPGETAIHRERVNPAIIANISGVGFSMAENAGRFRKPVFHHQGTTYVVVNPQKNFLQVNADGAGTWGEFDERDGNYTSTLLKSVEMQLADAVKTGAAAKTSLNMVEINGNVNFAQIQKTAKALGELLGIDCIVEQEYVGDRIVGYKLGAPAHDIGGASVSLLPPGRLKNPLVPKAGDYLVAVTSQEEDSNGRANGATSKRRIVDDALGREWHATKVGKAIMPYMKGITLLYPAMREATVKAAATSIGHLSGSAWKGKVAGPLAKYGLHAEIEDMFEPSWQDKLLMAVSGSSLEELLAQWPLNTQGYGTTKNPNRFISIMERHGHRAKVIGRLEKAHNGKTGITFKHIKDSKGEPIYFSGKQSSIGTIHPETF